MKAIRGVKTAPFVEEKGGGVRCVSIPILNLFRGVFFFFQCDVIKRNRESRLPFISMSRFNNLKWKKNVYKRFFAGVAAAIVTFQMTDRKIDEGNIF